MSAGSAAPAPPGSTQNKGQTTLADGRTYQDLPDGRRLWSDGTVTGTNDIPNAGNYTDAVEKTAAAGQAAIDRQTTANRPDQTNAFGSTVRWEIGPDGRPRQVQSLGGDLGQLNTSLQGQALGAMGTPFDLSGLPGINDGSAARDQAINASYGQATSRLDPQWQQREDQARTQLLNQGLTEGSEAYQTAFSNLGRDRNDAYGSAMNSAIEQGRRAGGDIFDQSMRSRGQALSDMLLKRNLPLQDLGQLSQFTQQGQFHGSGSASGPNYLAALLGQDSATMNRYQMNQDQQNQQWSQFFDLLDSLNPIGGGG